MKNKNNITGLVAVVVLAITAINALGQTLPVLFISGATNASKPGFQEFTNQCPPLVRYYLKDDFTAQRSLQTTDGEVSASYTISQETVIDKITKLQSMSSANGSLSYLDTNENTGWSATGSADPSNGWTVVASIDGIQETNVYGIAYPNYVPFDYSSIPDYGLDLMDGQNTEWTELGQIENSLSGTALTTSITLSAANGAMENGIGCNGTAQSTEQLSDEFTTDDLLQPVQLNSQLNQGNDGASVSLSGDQSLYSANAAEDWFLIQTPVKGKFKVPYVLRINIGGVDLYSTNYFSIYGDGTPHYYPTGEGIKLNPPVATVPAGCANPYYIGGTEDVTLGSFLCMDDGSDQGNYCPCSCFPIQSGMPVWYVSEPYINLWVVDKPVAYKTSLGREVSFEMKSKQRDTRPSVVNGQSSYIPSRGWENNWSSYVEFTGATVTNLDGSFGSFCFSNWTATVYEAGGGELNFNSGISQDVNSGDILMPMDGISAHIYPNSSIVPQGGPDVYGTSGFRVIHPDGSQDLYGLVSPIYPTNYIQTVPVTYNAGDLPPQVSGYFPVAADGAVFEISPVVVGQFTNSGTANGVLEPDPTSWLPSGGSSGFGTITLTTNEQITVSNQPPTADALLTEKIDPYGNKIYLTYIFTNNQYELASLKDYDGQQTGFQYDTNGNLAEVDMPYGLSARMQYSSTTNAQLLSITDAQGMTSSFGYNTNEEISSITTPYGTNQFSYFDASPDSSAIFNVQEDRAILATLPDQSHELYSYFNTISNGVPSIFPPGSMPSAPPQAYPLDNGQTNDPDSIISCRDSFFWDREQCSQLSTLNVGNLNSLTARDFLLGRMRHWRVGENGQTLGTQCSILQEPSPDGNQSGQQTWYEYGNYGGFSWVQQDDDMKPVFEIRLQPDGSTWYSQASYNQDAQQTTFESLATDENGNNVLRTFNYNYAQVAYEEYCPQDGVTNQWNGSWLQSVNGPGVSESIDNWNPSSITLTTNRNGLDFVSEYPHWNFEEIDNGDGTFSDFYFNGREQNSGGRSATGLTTTNLFSPQGFLEQTIAFETKATNSFQFGNGLLLNWVNPSGLSTTFYWDNLLRMTGKSYSDGTTESNIYTHLDVTDHKSRMGDWCHAGYDSLREMNWFSDYNGNKTSYGYCFCGGLAQIVDPLLNGTTLTRDFAGRVTKVSFSDSTGKTSSRSFSRDSLGRITNVTDDNGFSANFQYDMQDLVTNIYNSNGVLFSSTYNEANLPVIMENANGLLETNTYGYGNLYLLTDKNWGAGLAAHYSYDSRLVSSKMDGSGNVMNYGYDAAGRLDSVADGNGDYTNNYVYTPANLIQAITDGRGNVTSFKYDLFGNRISRMDGNMNLVQTNSYDGNGDCVAQWTPASGLESFYYDSNGNLYRKTYASQPAITASYDGLNRLVSINDALGQTTFTYQNFGAFYSEISSETGPWESDSVNYEYKNRLETGLSLVSSATPWNENFAYDGNLRVKSASSPAGTFNFSYLGSGRMIQAIQNSNGGLFARSYDSAGQTLETSMEWNNSVLDSMNYTNDASGNRTGFQRMNGSYNSLAYDDIHQLTGDQGFEPVGSPRSNEQFGYGYDLAGNMDWKTNGAMVQQFFYDNANQLTSARVFGSAISFYGSISNSPGSLTVNGQSATVNQDLTFTLNNGLPYNSGSNGFSMTMQMGPSTVTNNFSINIPQNTQLAFDGNGNVLSDGQHGYAYDGDNQLISVTCTNQWQLRYVYDGFGRRRIRQEYEWINGQWLKGSETRFIYDGMNVLQERNSLNLPVATYTRGPDLSGALQGASGIGGLLARTDGNGQSAYYSADANGNITGMVDGNGKVVARYEYDPYGNLLGMWGGLATVNHYRFSSKEIEPLTGDYYFGYRYYNPNWQRWPNRDPIAENGGINLYRFVGNDPIDLVDLLGLNYATTWAAYGAVGGASGAALGSVAVDAYTGGLNIAATPTEVAGGAAAGAWVGGMLGTAADWLTGNSSVVQSPGNNPPFTGTPGSTSVGGTGSRTYGPDGYPLTDRDLPHPGESGTGNKDHCHDWARPQDGGPPIGPPGQPNPYRGPSRDPQPGDPPAPRGPNVPPPN